MLCQILTIPTSFVVEQYSSSIISNICCLTVSEKAKKSIFQVPYPKSPGNTSRQKQLIVYCKQTVLIKGIIFLSFVLNTLLILVIFHLGLPLLLLSKVTCDSFRKMVTVDVGFCLHQQAILFTSRMLCKRCSGG